MPPRLVLLSYVMPDGTAGAFALDASINEQHVTTAQVTQHQVERGSPVSDFIRPLPRRLTLEGMVTNTPLVQPQIATVGTASKILSLQPGAPTPKQGQATANRPSATGAQTFTVNWTVEDFGAPFDAVRDFFGGIVDAALGGALWGVYTTLNTYSQMVIVNFSVPRNVESGQSIRPAIDFQELRFADTQVVTAAVRAIKKRGPKPTTEVTEEGAPSAPKRSFLKSIIDYATGAAQANP